MSKPINLGVFEDEDDMVNSENSAPERVISNGYDTATVNFGPTQPQQIPNIEAFSLNAPARTEEEVVAAPACDVSQQALPQENFAAPPGESGNDNSDNSENIAGDINEMEPKISVATVPANNEEQINEELAPILCNVPEEIKAKILDLPFSIRSKIMSISPTKRRELLIKLSANLTVTEADVTEKPEEYDEKPKCTRKFVRVQNTPMWIIAWIQLPGFMYQAIDNCSLNVNLPIIAKELNVETGTVQWLVHIALIVLIGLGPIIPSLSEKFGLTRLLKFGAVVYCIFGLAFFFCYNTFIGLVITRIFVGIGLAFAIPATTPVCFMLCKPGSIRTLMVLATTTIPIGGFLASFVCGYISSSIGWQYMHLITFLFGVFHVVYMFVMLPNFTPTRKDVKIDFVGAIILAIATISFIFSLILFGMDSVDIYIPPILLVVAIGVFVGWWFFNKKKKNPLLPFSAFTRRSVVSLISVFLSQCAYTACRFYLPWIYSVDYNTDNSIAGIFQAVPFVFGAAYTFLGSHISSRVIARRVVVAHLIMNVISLVIQLCTLGGFVYITILTDSINTMALLTILTTVQSTAMSTAPRSVAQVFGTLTRLFTDSGTSTGTALACIIKKYSTDPYGSLKPLQSYLVLDGVGIVFHLLNIWCAYVIGITRFDRGKKGFTEKKFAKYQKKNMKDGYSAELVEVEAGATDNIADETYMRIWTRF